MIKLPISLGTCVKLQCPRSNLLIEINPCIEVGDRLMELGFLLSDAKDEKSENNNFDCDPLNPDKFSTFEQPVRLSIWRDFNVKMPCGSFVRFLQFFKSKTSSLPRHSIDL